MANEAEALRALMTQQVMGEMPDHLKAAKRVNVESSDWMDDWHVGFGKDESCQIEGTANHWNWLALLILGLADPKDRPYDEDKLLPINPAALRAVWEGFVSGSLIHRSALAEDTARAAEGWQPIETAPRNKAIQVYVPNLDYYGNEGVYAGMLVDMGTGPRWMTFAWAMGRDMNEEVLPTHWRHLPAPPALPLTKETADANR